MSRGVLYLAAGRSFVDKAIRSARSVKRNNPSLSATIYADEDVDAEVFNQVHKTEGPVEDVGDFILDERHFPYDRNLYLDADTYVCGDISEVFELLERFDLAAAHNVGRTNFNEEIYEMNDVVIPDAFTEYNTGVLAYNDCTAIRELFTDWNGLYTEMEYGENRYNQPSFRVALYNRDVALATLPPEYNFMMHTVGFVDGEVKICHQCASEIAPSDFAKRINSTLQKRVITWEKTPFRIVTDSQRSTRNEVRKLVRDAKQLHRDEGTLSVLEAAVQKLLPRRP